MKQIATTLAQTALTCLAFQCLHFHTGSVVLALAVVGALTGAITWSKQ